MVEEAGGVISALGGEPFDVRKGRIVAANSALHAQMLEVIRQHRAGR
jgi:fructose-1,6-bisphosphatase/inositol monophosphatase family enzyme